MSQERYKLSTEAAKVGVWDWDLESNKFYIDPNIKEILGYKDKEIPNDIDIWTTYVHPGDLKPVMASAQACIDGKKPEYIIEHRMMHKDGSVRWILSNGKVLRDKNGKAVRMIGTDTDITERKLAEEAFIESEQRFRMMAEASPDYIFQTDKNGKTVYCSPAIKRILGYTPEERQGKKFSTIISPSELSRAKTLFKKVFKGVIIQNLEINLLHKSGRNVPIEVSVVPILENGKVNRIFGIARDITERKKAEDSLRESEEKFRILAENSPNMIFINKKGKVVYANKRCEEVMGYRREEFYSPDFDYLNIVASEYVDLVKGKFRKHMEGEDVSPYEYAILSKKGKRIEALISTKLITYEGDNAILGIITDITERKKVEDELRESEHRYYSLFEDSPISLWEENFSQVKKYIDKLKKRGIKDFETYLVKHPDAVEKCAEMVKVLDVNKTTLNLFKAKNKKELKQKLSKTFIKESYNAFREELVSIARGKTLFETEAITRTLKGEKNNILIRWTVAPGCEQTFSKVLVSIVDITEHKKADEALRESEEKIKNIFASIGDAVTVTDLKGKVIECNQATLDLHGFSSKEDVFGRSSFDFVAPKDHARARRNLEKTLEQGLVKDVEYTLLTKDKRQF
ncbi:MAG: PAS domain S-box protein, partial [Candidatus Hodarchaeota archaeon]